MKEELFVQIFLMILVSFLFVVFFIPFVKKIAVAIGAMDYPRERHIHNKPMPKLGGLAIFFGFLLGYMIFGKHIASTQMIAILISSFVLILTGVVDDICELKPSTQLMGQLIAACVTVFYGNILIKDLSAFGFYIDFGVFAYPITIFFIVGCINCINFIDGLDGLSSGISAIYFLTIGIIAVLQGKFGIDFILTFVMLGAVLGFLVHNFNPASIFAGQCGSMFMGYMISAIALLGFKNVTLSSLIVPLLILAIPILDTIFAILRRILKGESPMKADKFHIHHQLLNRNFSQRATVLIIYIINILFAFASIIYVLKDRMLGYIIYGILLFLVLLFVLKTNVIVDQESVKEKLMDKILKRKK